MKIDVIYISDTNKNNIFLGSNSLKETNGLLFNTLRFYFLNLTSFKNGKFGILFCDYFSNWLIFIKLIKRKKTRIAIMNLDMQTPLSLQEIGLIYILKRYKIPIIFETKRSQETMNLKSNYVKKKFIKMIGNCHLILPDERMSSIYTPYFLTSNIYNISLQTNSNASVKDKKINLDLNTVEFYMFVNDIEYAKTILKACQELKNKKYNFKFIFTNKDVLTFLPQLHEQIRIAKLMGVVEYRNSNNLNLGNVNTILIHQDHAQDNFFPQEVLDALFLGRVIIGEQNLAANGLVNTDLNGSIYDSKDPSSLFDQMNYYLSNPDIISTRGNESKKTYYSYFSQTANGNKLLNLISNHILKSTH